MKTEPLVSIIINNYNYDRFLAEAIDSALAQTYSNIEVIVVDDGSTDGSREIISRYGHQIISIMKDNGGQASCLNKGYKACTGEIICFLDSDDLFCKEKVEKLVSLFAQVSIVDPSIILFDLSEAIDKEGNLTGDEMAGHLNIEDVDWRLFSQQIGRSYPFFYGQLSKVFTSNQMYKFASKYRHIPFIGMPTSSVSISRALADKIFPLPVNKLKVMADVFIVKAASLIGSIYSTNLMLTRYRLHGNNGYAGKKRSLEVEQLFYKTQDEFLNSKLEEGNRKPILSFPDSMQAKGFYRVYYGYKCSKELFVLAVKVITWHIDLVTIDFFIKTLLLAFIFRIKSIVPFGGLRHGDV